MSVLQFAGPNRMTDAEYEAERARLRELYGDGSKDAAYGKTDQALAMLFYRSGWTQEELAKKEGKSAQRIAQILRFGRFINYSTAVEFPKNLTERRFRSYWEQGDETQPNELARFQAVLALMREDMKLVVDRRPTIAPVIIEKFGDGKWHARETVARALNTDPNHVAATIDRMRVQKGVSKVERKPVGQTFSYRIFPKESTEHMISSLELIEKLGPIIEGLNDQGKKNMATASPSTVALLAHQLQQLLNDWTT
jgi:transcriptional regulator with XRE-family HTH domain